MAKAQTVALGIAIEVRDEASAILKKVGGSAGDLASSMSAAQDAAFDFGKTLGEQPRGLAKTRDSLAGLGKSMLGIGGNFEGVDQHAQGLISALGGIVEAIPVVGGVLAKTGGAIFSIMTRVGEVRKEVAQLEIQFLGLGNTTSDLTLEFLTLSNKFHRTQEDIMHLTNSLGTVDKDFVGTTQRALEAGKALGIADDRAGDLILTSDAFGVTKEKFADLAGSVLQFQKEFNLPALTENLPDIFDSVRRSSVALGTKFEDTVAPATQSVSMAAGILNKKMGMLPKQAAQAALQFTSSFQEMGFNIQAVFTGVEDTFNSKTDAILELFVRTKRSAGDAFDAINKAAAGSPEGFKEIGNALEDMAKSGDRSINRMRVLLVQQFGPEAQKIFENIGDAGQSAFGDQFATSVKKVRTPAEEFQATMERVLGSTDELVKGLNASANNLVNVFGTQMPESVGKLEKIMTSALGIFTTFEDKGIGGVAGEVDKFLSGGLDPLMEKFKDWGKMVSGAGFFDDFKSGLHDVIDSLKEISAFFKNLGQSKAWQTLFGYQMPSAGDIKGAMKEGAGAIPLAQLPQGMIDRAQRVAENASGQPGLMGRIAGETPLLDPTTVARKALADEIENARRVQALSEGDFFTKLNNMERTNPAAAKILLELRAAKIDLGGQVDVLGGKTMTDTTKGSLNVGTGD